METTEDVAAPCSVAVRPGLAGRLLRGDPAVEPLEEYVAAAGGYAGSGAGGLDAEGLLDLIEQSGLRGRGGAAFPLATKAPSAPWAGGTWASAREEAERAGRHPLPGGTPVAEPANVAGEETAAVRAINGGPAKPANKPPRPSEAGVSDRPTLVSNVEPLANLPFLYRHGADVWRRAGTPASPGTFLATVSGGGRPPAPGAGPP